MLEKAVKPCFEWKKVAYCAKSTAQIKIVQVEIVTYII